MAQVTQRPNSTPSKARDIPPNGLRVAPPVSIPTPSSVQLLKQGHVNLGTFSPVNQDGCFEFDRVIKSGQVLKRTRKTKSWGPVHLVLRPNLLSIYKNADETKLRHQINLSELTATARQRDPKRKASNVFGLFSPSRNFHFSGQSDRDAQEWVELIRREARLDEEEGEMFLTSPEENKPGVREMRLHPATAYHDRATAAATAGGGGGGGYSSSEAELSAPRPRLPMPKHSRDATSTSTSAPPPPPQQQQAQWTSQAEHYSGPDAGSYSDFSDAGVVGGLQHSALSLSLNDFRRDNVGGGEVVTQPVPSIYAGSQPIVRRNASQMSGVGGVQDEERVVCQGWLNFLKSTRGMRQWRKAWVVLRPKNIAFYKNEEEYSATLILPFSSIIDAVDLDPISRRHPYCMQIIAEDRNYRFCAQDEDALARWLGALKSLLAKRKEAALLKNGSPK